MKLVYVVSKYTTANSNYRLHLPNPYNKALPICGVKSFSIEFAEGKKPTCQKCLKLFNDCKIYPISYLAEVIYDR